MEELKIFSIIIGVIMLVCAGFGTLFRTKTSIPQEEKEFQDKVINGEI